MMPVENGAVEIGDLKSQNPKGESKKSRDTGRRKQKKNRQSAAAGDGSDSVAYEEYFRNVFEKFNFVESAASKKKADSDLESKSQDTPQKERGIGISNKKKKLQRRMKIAELKQICRNPDVVEVWDATASDPKLLVHLKSYRNTVAVPRHWCQRRKFLQGKRGVEKRPFRLPDFIAATGIEKIRQAYVEKEGSKKLKQKQRGRMQPKGGNMEIDYQILHDAFFKHQTKPELTCHGDLYYEGKEFEVKLREIMKPGVLSQELKEALAMPEGAPPPWLINMQRYGPPPSYPHLKILHQGQHNCDEETVDKTKHWGELEEELEEEEEEEEEFEDGIQSVDSLSSNTSTGIETPDVIDLRKQQKAPDVMDNRKQEPERALYQVVEEKEEKIGPGTLLAPSHTYVINTGTQDKTGAKRVDLVRGQKADKVDVTLAPEELEVMEDVLAGKYEEAREEEKLGTQCEDFSDMVGENEKKRKRKESKSKKKDFRF